MEIINEVWMQMDEAQKAKQIYQTETKSTMFLKEGMHLQAQ